MAGSRDGIKRDKQKKPGRGSEERRSGGVIYIYIIRFWIALKYYLLMM